MLMFSKNLSYKNFTAGLSGIRRNGRYPSVIHIITENCPDETNGIIENSARSEGQFRPAKDSSADKMQHLKLPALKSSVSNFRNNNNIFWPFAKASPSVGEKFPLHLLNKSLSTSSIVWSKKSYSVVNVTKNFDPNYDYPHLSKIFGTENSLMRSDAYNQALVEAARRRAALNECKAAGKELKSYEFKRPQVNIKGWAAYKTNIRPAFESETQISKSSQPSKRNTQQLDKSATKSTSRQPLDLWNADKTKFTHGMKSKLKAYRPCPPPLKSPKLTKDDTQNEFRTAKIADAGRKISEPGKTADLWGASTISIVHHGLKNETQSFKPYSGFVKAENSDLNRNESCKTSNVRNEQKHKLHSSNNCPPPVKLKKQADGDCKKDDPCKPTDPCQPADPCKEELEKLQKRKEEEQKRNRNKMPTGCVDPKCKKDDKCKKSPKSPYKVASARRRSQRRTSTAVRRLRGCFNTADKKAICNENKHCDIQQIVGFDRKKRPYSASASVTDKNNTNEASKQTDHWCNKGQKGADPGQKTEDHSEGIKQKDGPCGSKTKDPCQKTENLTGDVKQKNGPCGGKEKDPCQKTENLTGDVKQKNGPCGGKEKDPCQKTEEPSGDLKQKDGPCGSKTKDLCQKTEEPSGDLKQKDGPCGSKTKDPCQKTENLTGDVKQKNGPCGGKKKDPCQKTEEPSGDLKQKDGPCGSKTKEPCQKTADPSGDLKQKNGSCGSKKNNPSEDKPPNPCGSSKKDSTSPCGNRKQEEFTKDKKKDPCENIKQMEDPCKKKDPCYENKRKEESNDSNDKKPSPSTSRTNDPDKIPCKTCTSAEEREPTSAQELKSTVRRDCGEPTRSDCSNTKVSSSIKEVQRAEPGKASSSLSLAKTTAKRDCGRTTRSDSSNIKISSSSCGSLKEEQRKGPCKTEKKEAPSKSLPKTSANQDCARPQKSTNPNCSNLKESSSTSGNLKKSVSDCSSLRKEQKKDPSKATSSREIKIPPSSSTHKTVASPDCSKPKRSTKPNCSNTRGNTKEEPIKYPCKANASTETVKPASKSASKTSLNPDCSKQKRDTSGNISKPFSTLTLSANESLTRMISRTLATLPTIKNNIFIRKFSSKSRDKNDKDPDEIGKKSRCKSVGTTVPPKRKPTFNPHPNESLRQCYPTYDMDCRKLCKDARKTDCRKYAFLEETNTNKRKGKK